jgi:hypothetical protein
MSMWLRRTSNVCAVAATALVLSSLGPVGAAYAGDLYPGPHGVAKPMERARVEVDRRVGQVTLDITFSRQATRDPWPLAIAFERSNSAWCQPVPWALKAAVFVEDDWRTTRVVPKGRISVSATKVSQRTWRYVITSPLLKNSKLNCVWTSVTSPIPEHDWHVSGWALMGRL